MSIISSISSQMFNANEQSGINILHSPHSGLADTSGNTAEKIPENLHSNEIPNIVNICQNGSRNNKCNTVTNKESQLFSVGDMDAKVNTDLHSDDDVDQNDICCADLPDAKKGEEAHSINVEKDECSSTNIHEEDLHSSLRTVKIISESWLNLQCATNDDDHVTISKTEFEVLTSKLEHLIGRLEEDVSNLKLTLTSVTNMLSVTNVANGEIKNNNETEIKQQTTEVTKNLNDNIKVIDNVDTKLSHITIINIDTDHDKVSKAICKIPDVRRPKPLRTNEKNGTLLNRMYVVSGGNKENEEILDSLIVKQRKGPESGTRRRSARLMGKVLNDLNASNDSFVNLENELDINMKSNTPITPLANRTSAKNRYKDKKMVRPLQEYMDMKSRLSCLLTPNINRFNPSESKSDINRDTDDTKTAVSDKLLAELYNLYENS